MRGPGRSRRWAVRRAARDVLLRARHPRNHIAYYRAVMQDTVAQGAARAVGNSDRRHWRESGARQFDYLRKHGLRPGHRLLEIGCGNLRAGWRFIDYLEPGGYLFLGHAESVAKAGVNFEPIVVGDSLIYQKPVNAAKKVAAAQERK